MTTPTFTCQICGRPIKAKSGLIAHHGYRRPCEGWQTSSCPGARHVPYEVGHDVLDREIERVPAAIDRVTTSMAAFVANPPAKLTCETGTGRTIEVERPADFDPQATWGYVASRSYKHLYLRRIDADRRTIADLIAYRTELKARRAAWKAPA